MRVLSTIFYLIKRRRQYIFVVMSFSTLRILLLRYLSPIIILLFVFIAVFKCVVITIHWKYSRFAIQCKETLCNGENIKNAGFYFCMFIWQTLENCSIYQYIPISPCIKLNCLEIGYLSASSAIETRLKPFVIMNLISEPFQISDVVDMVSCVALWVVFIPSTGVRDISAAY